MSLIPVPELAVVLLIALVVVGARTLRDRGRRVDTERERVKLIASCVLLMIISVPLIMRIVPPNGVYGFRVAATQSNRAIWYQSNAFMGWALLVSASVSATLLLLIRPRAGWWRLWAAFLVPVCGAMVASFMYLNTLRP